MKEKAGKIAGLLIVIAGAYFTLSSGDRLHRSLVKNRYLTIGYITEGNSQSPRSSRVTFTFTYNYKGKAYQNYSYPYDFTDNVDHSPLFTGKSYAVVIDTTNPTNSDILLTKAKFDEFNFPYPDSLSWTTQYLK